MAKKQVRAKCRGENMLPRDLENLVLQRIGAAAALTPKKDAWVLFGALEALVRMLAPEMKLPPSGVKKPDKAELRRLDSRARDVLGDALRGALLLCPGTEKQLATLLLGPMLLMSQGNLRFGWYTESADERAESLQCHPEQVGLGR